MTNQAGSTQGKLPVKLTIMVHTLTSRRSYVLNFQKYENFCKNNALLTVLKILTK